MKAAFKICGCGIEYKDKEDFTSRCEFVGNWDRFGLALYNCACLSTITIEMFEGSKAAAKAQMIKDHEESKGAS